MSVEKVLCHTIIAGELFVVVVVVFISQYYIQFGHFFQMKQLR